MTTPTPQRKTRKAWAAVSKTGAFLAACRDEFSAELEGQTYYGYGQVVPCEIIYTLPTRTRTKTSKQK